MKASLLGRIVFGVSGVLFGVIALMWRDADTWQSMIRILRLPGGAIAGTIVMAGLIAGGVGILYSRSLRPAAILLLAVFAAFTLSCVPGIAAAPKVYGGYVPFFEMLSLFCGALALYAPGRLARIGLGLCATSFMLAQIFYLKFTASLVPAWIPPNQTFWAILTTVAFGLAALAMLINQRARLATQLMTLMIVLFGILVWVPRVSTQPQSHNNWSEFALNFLIAGAAWVVADTTK